ncbi:hypothetical protein Tco_0570969 [Tanacetum coccineum]
MAESSSHNPPSPEITPKEEHVTLDKPESQNPFLPTDLVVSDFISKCCLKEAFTRDPTHYKEYLCEFWYTTKTLDDSTIWVSTPTGRIRGDIGITTFRNDFRAHYLPYSDKTKSARDRLKIIHTDSSTNEESRADEISKKIKLEDLSDLMKDTRSAFFTPDSPQDEPIIVLDKSEEE